MFLCLLVAVSSRFSGEYAPLSAFPSGALFLSISKHVAMPLIWKSFSLLDPSPIFLLPIDSRTSWIIYIYFLSSSFESTPSKLLPPLLCRNCACQCPQGFYASRSPWHFSVLILTRLAAVSDTRDPSPFFLALSSFDSVLQFPSLSSPASSFWISNGWHFPVLEHTQ